MKLKTFSLLLLVVLLGTTGFNAVAQDTDFEIIYQRMYERYLDKSPSQTAVDKLLQIMTPEGAFKGINYHATDGSPRKHVQSLITLARAYQHPESPYYHQPKLRDSYLKSLNFWVDTNHQAKNWWYRYIPYPKELSTGIILMSREIEQDKALFDKCIAYLRWSYETARPGLMTGANGADIIMGSFAASILTRNDAQMRDFQQRMTRLLTIQPVEGVQPDYLFAQHCGSGRQLYFTNYGKEFVNSMLNYLELCQGTRYQSAGLELLEKLFVEGVQWIFYNKQYDPNNAGRYIHCNQYATPIKLLAERVCRLSTPDMKPQTEQALRRIAGENSLEGNRMFWRFDYMIHRRAGYMTSSRMTSTRTVGNEAGNGDGNFNYYASNGVNYLFVTGREYDRNFFRKFNNRQYPGITAEQDDAPLPIPDWGEGGNNGNSYAGGVSDSIYGACGMLLDRRSLQAHKAWFYFDKEYICLGAGIRNPEGKADVFTTLNQCNRDGEVLYARKGKVSTLTGETACVQADWVIHGQTGYFNLQRGAQYVIACDTALFSLNVNHGTRPCNGQYAYAVVPGLSDASAAARYAKQLPVKILANSETVQAVFHQTLGITEALFYQPGELKLDNGDLIRTDTPCALLWNEGKQKLSVANPHCESANPASIRVTLVRNGHPVEVSFDMPQQESAGRSVAKFVSLPQN